MTNEQDNLEEISAEEVRAAAKEEQALADEALSTHLNQRVMLLRAALNRANADKQKLQADVQRLQTALEQLAQDGPQQDNNFPVVPGEVAS